LVLGLCPGRLVEFDDDITEFDTHFSAGKRLRKIEFEIKIISRNIGTDKPGCAKDTKTAIAVRTVIGAIFAVVEVNAVYHEKAKRRNE